MNTILRIAVEDEKWPLEVFFSSTLPPLDNERIELDIFI
jgi:hypothetical protein